MEQSEEKAQDYTVKEAILLWKFCVDEGRCDFRLDVEAGRFFGESLLQKAPQFLQEEESHLIGFVGA